MSNLSSQQATIAVALTTVAAASIGFMVLNTRIKKKRNSKQKIEVVQLNIYPVKSCGEISMDQIKTTSCGFQYDRILQVIDKDGKFCTPRDQKYEKLFHIKPSLDINLSTGDIVLILDYNGPSTATNSLSSLELDLSPNAVETKPVKVETMEQGDINLVDYGDGAARWLEEVIGVEGLRLTGIPPPPLSTKTESDDTKYNRFVIVNPNQGEELPKSSDNDGSRWDVSLADEAPYLLTNEASLYDLNKRLIERKQHPVNMNRFRPNIVMSSGSLKPWEEDTIKRLRIGTVDEGVEFYVWQRCGRCTMTTIDRTTLERSGGEPLKTLSTFRERTNGQRNFGVHLIPVDPTKELNISIGDEITILEYDNDRKQEWMKLHNDK